MKKILLLTLSLVACMCAMAGDWTLPVPKTVPLEMGKTVYFYNIEAKQFLTRGNAWGAQMSLGETGLPVVVKEKADTEYTDGGTYVMLWNDKDKAYFDWDASGRQGWVDRAEAEALASELAIWKLQVNADGSFQFGVPNESKACESPEFDEEAPAFNAKLWAGWNGYEGNTEVIPCLDTEFYTTGYLWSAVTPEEYEAFSATYPQRKALYTLIVKAEADGVNIPARIADVFNKADATAEELTAASADLANVMLKHDLEEKGEADVTAQYIVNPNTDEDNNGWSNTVGQSWWDTDNWHIKPENIENAEGTSSMSNYLCRFVWSGGWLGNLPNTETSQSATLPAGSYRLEADCVGFQEGDGADAYGSPQDWTGQIKGLYLFAKNELGETLTAVETAGKEPKRFAVEFRSAGGETTFGLKVIDAFGSFFGGDNFRLYCTGLMGSPEIVELQTIKDELQKRIENSTDEPFSLATITKAEEFVNEAEEVIDSEDDAAAVALIDKGKQLVEAISVEIAAYQRVRDAYDEAQGYIDGGEFEVFGEDVVEQIRANAVEMLDPIEQGKVTPEEAVALIEDYASKLAHIIASDVNAIDEGLDATCLLHNGQFSRGKEFSGGSGTAGIPGWTGTLPWSYNLKGAAAGQIEYIGQDFDLYQELKNMPAGVYTIEFRGFYRWGQKDAVVAAMDTPEGEANNTSRFYMNDFAAPIKAITEDARPLGEGDEEGNGMYPIGKTDEEGNALYMPDATWYYMWRNTDCHINRGAVLVEEGQSLRIGFRASGEDKERWSLISAPKLRYEGTSERAMALLGDPTAISAPSTAIPTTAGVYNLNGQRISAPQRGVNIVVETQADGSVSVRKVLVK